MLAGPSGTDIALGCVAGLLSAAQCMLLACGVGAKPCTLSFAAACLVAVWVLRNLKTGLIMLLHAWLSIRSAQFPRQEREVLGCKYVQQLLQPPAYHCALVLLTQASLPLISVHMVQADSRGQALPISLGVAHAVHSLGQGCCGSLLYQ